MNPPIQLELGQRDCRRVLDDTGALLARYRTDTGAVYYDYRPITPSDRLVPEDVAATLLLNSQAGWRAVNSVMERGASIDLRSLPSKPLEETNVEERRQVALLIADVAQWPGFGASMATKVLHKKRPQLIPILDNQAIFGAYMNPTWPGQAATSFTEKRLSFIEQAIGWIAMDLTRAENQMPWQQLHLLEPARARVELFDSIWWIHFRIVQPVQRR